MFVKVNSAGINGISARMILTEGDVGNGLPSFTLVGYLASEVREAQDRVRTAIKNAGFTLPAKKITINLSPADQRKEGTAYDLSIAVAVLGAYGLLPMERLEQCLVVGELGLDGRIKPVHGVMAMAIAAKRAGMVHCFVPKENAQEALAIEGIRVTGLNSLKEFADMLVSSAPIPETLRENDSDRTKEAVWDVDYSEVGGQLFLRRAAEIAAAGMHNLLFTGPAGTGKTMIARRLPTILPPLTMEENLEISQIYSVCGLLAQGSALFGKRPFRSPHHTVTAQSLTGGGKPVKPGELSLATGGVLFLDELTLFRKEAIEILRQPLEEHKVHVSRVWGKYDFPADFLLCAAMNLCPCGHFPGDRCQCTPAQIRQYLSRLSRPLMERFDICAQASPVPYEELRRTDQRGEPSAAIRARVERAREIQTMRFRGTSVRCNGRMGEAQVRTFCTLGEKEEAFLKQIYQSRSMSARGLRKILVVSRTIADLAGSEAIQREHLAEAAGYRALEEKIWD